jgi:hypothetical protein
MDLIVFLNINFIECVRPCGVWDPILSCCVAVIKTMSKGRLAVLVLL